MVRDAVMLVGKTCSLIPPTKVEGISGLERLRRTVGSFPTEVGGFKPDFWKMNYFYGENGRFRYSKFVLKVAYRLSK